MWNDPAIAALNPGVTLPATKINVVHRSDGSGTTFNFVNYLSKVSPEWKTKVGEGTTVNWPAGIGGKGNEGVAAYVKQIKGSIGYVELAYALQNKMTYTRCRTPRASSCSPAPKLPGRRRQRRLEEREGLLPGDHQRPGREGLADHRDQLHPDVQAAEGRQAQCRRIDFFNWALRERRRRRRRRWTTCRCRRNWWQQVEAYWTAEFK